jgi:Gpi18-like mannosyltransferase
MVLPPAVRQLKTRIDDFLSRIRDHPAIYQPLLVFISLRFLLLIWMWGVRQVFHQPILPDPVLRPYLDVAIEKNPLLEPWQRWDTLHYQAIAERGYTAFDSALFVPPLYPLLIRAVSRFGIGSTLLSGILVSNAAFLCSLFVFYQLTAMEMQSPDDAARAVLYLAIFPTAFFFFAAYTESLFLLAALLTLKYVRIGKYWQAGIWGGLAALIRLPGALMLLPLSYTAVGQWVKERIWKPWIAVFITLLGSVVFPLYIWLFLRQPPWTPWVIQEARFKGGFTFPGVNILQAIQGILKGAASPNNFIDLGFLVLFTVCLIPVWRRLPRIYILFYISYLGLYLTRTSTIDPLLSLGRYVLVFFPAFIIMGNWGRNPVVHRIILYISLIGLLYLSGEFAIWGWAG